MNPSAAAPSTSWNAIQYALSAIHAQVPEILVLNNRSNAPWFLEAIEQPDGEPAEGTLEVARGGRPLQALKVPGDQVVLEPLGSYLLVFRRTAGGGYRFPFRLVDGRGRCQVFVAQEDPAFGGTVRPRPEPGAGPERCVAREEGDYRWAILGEAFSAGAAPVTHPAAGLPSLEDRR